MAGGAAAHRGAPRLDLQERFSTRVEAGYRRGIVAAIGAVHTFSILISFASTMGRDSLRVSNEHRRAIRRTCVTNHVISLRQSPNLQLGLLHNTCRVAQAEFHLPFRIHEGRPADLALRNLEIDFLRNEPQSLS